MYLSSMHLHLNACNNTFFKCSHTGMYTCVFHFVDAQIETCQT